MMPYVRIVHQWDDTTLTSIEVGSEEDAHPDLLDELTARALRVWHDTCAAPETEA